MQRKLITLIDYATALVSKKRKKKKDIKKNNKKITFKKAKKISSLFCQGNEGPLSNPLPRGFAAPSPARTEKKVRCATMYSTIHR